MVVAMCSASGVCIVVPKVQNMCVVCVCAVKCSSLTDLIPHRLFTFVVGVCVDIYFVVVLLADCVGVLLYVLGIFAFACRIAICFGIC